MQILMSLHNTWIKKIFSKEKTLEFRTKIGKDFKIGQTVYLYETSKNKGRKAIVGQFTIKDIKEIPQAKIGCYGLLPYYCLNILRDKETYNQVMKAYSINIPNYNPSIKLDYIYAIERLEALSRGEDFNILGMDTLEFLEYDRKIKKAQKLVTACDEWLKKIGYYNEFDETFYKYYIEISDAYEYEVPLPLNNFTCKKKTLTRPPQSWCYVEKIDVNKEDYKC